MFEKLNSRITMSMKQRGSYVIIILFFGVLAYFSSQNIKQIGEEVNNMGNSQLPRVELIGTVKEDFTRVRLYLTQHAFEREGADKAQMEKLVNEDVEKIRINIKELEKSSNTVEDKKLVEEFSQDFEKFAAIIFFFFSESNSNQYDLVKREMEVMGPLGEKAVTSLDKLSNQINQDSDEIIKNSNQKIAIFINQIIFIAVFGGLISILISFIMIRVIKRSVRHVLNNVDKTTQSGAEIQNSIDHIFDNAKELDSSMNKANGSVSELVASIQQVASGTDTTSSSVDEISAAVEQMSASINLVAGSADNLNVSAEETSAAIQEMMASIEQVAGNAGNVGVTVEEISAAIEEMSLSIKGVNENTINLTNTAEQTAETIEEMVRSIKQVAETTYSVKVLTENVQQDAIEGTKSLAETLNGMEEISQVIKHGSIVMEHLGESSKEIGTIIEVIDDIADQTNLLALNAAIEAARAGEHGKGFAVVADEVRKLAERSTKATKEITDLINGIQKETSIAVTSIKVGEEKVRNGNQLAEKTNQAIKKISEGIAQVTEQMVLANKATSEQTKNSELIIKAVENVTNEATQMAHSTQQQSISAEEIVRGIMNTKNQVQQISQATAEQAKGGHSIVTAIENVTAQTSSVTNATKEQALTAEEIVRNINYMKDMVQQMSLATSEQAKYGKVIAHEVKNVLKQTEELNGSIETQTKEMEEVTSSIEDVKIQVLKLK